MSTDELLKGKIPCAETGIEIKKSLCSICDPCQCGLDLYVKDGEIIKVEGSMDNDLNRGTLCSKGAATRQYVYNPDRLRTPLRRLGKKGEGKFEEITWEEAYREIAAKLYQTKENFGPESAAFFVGYSKWARPFVRRMAFMFGSPNYCTESSTCSRATTMAWKLVFGDVGNPDIGSAACLLIWSSNPMHSRAPNAELYFKKKEAGMKLIVVDPRNTPTTALADIHLRLRPGTDGALALSMAHVIVRENLYDAAFVENYTHGFNEFKEFIAAFTPEKGEELTGVPAGKIEEAARMYATVKPAAFMTSASPVVHHTNGVQNYRAAMMLVGLTGNFGIKGGNVVQQASYIEHPSGFATNETVFSLPKPWGDMAPRIGQTEVPVWCELIDEAQSMFLPDYILSGEPYPIKSVIAFGMNHRMWPDSKRMEKALTELDFFVNLDLFMTDTCKYADIVLPVCSSVERGEFKGYSKGSVIHTTPAIKPLYDSISDLDFIFELSSRLKIDDEFLSKGYRTCIDYILEPAEITLDELLKHPNGTKITALTPQEYKKYETDGFNTPSGKMEFVSGVLEKYPDREGYDSLPVYAPPKQGRETTPELFKEYPLTLSTGSRLPMFVHTRTYRLPWTNSLRPKPAADINPADAEKLGIRQDDRIKITTPTGEIEVIANIMDIVLEGVVSMYHGHPKADANSLIAFDHRDPISAYPGFKAYLCKVEKVG